MNPLNYCTREAAQRLVDAGIVLETDFYYCKTHKGWKLHPKQKAKKYNWLAVIPAPSPAEVWRELPDSFGASTTLIIEKHDNEQIAGYFDWDTEDFNAFFRNTNLTDALVDLLIWVRKEKK